MNDAEFREQYKPVPVPAAFDEAKTLQDQVVFALAEIGEGTPDAVVRRLEELEPDAPDKELIASTHDTLTGLYTKGLIAGTEKGGELVYNLHKITHANEGHVDPRNLAPGLD